MCLVKKLVDSRKKVIIITQDEISYATDWFEDDTDSLENETNVTEMEKAYKEKLIQDCNIDTDNIKCWFVNREREDDTVYASHHALVRMKERCGWGEKTALRMLKKVYEQGIEEKDFTNAQKKYIQNKKKLTEADSFKIHGEYLYVFYKTTLLTVHRIPKLKYS